MTPRYQAVPDDDQLPPRDARTAPAPAPAAAPARARRVVDAEPADKLTPITVAIPASLRRRFKAECAARDITLQDAMAAALTAWLRQLPPA